MANIYIYSDESGTFDYKNYKYFVYGGILFLSKETKDEASRRYLSVERMIRKCFSFRKSEEIKASKIPFKLRKKLLAVYKKQESYPFCIVIKLNDLKQKETISSHPKSKQRYMDWAYKMGIKALLKRLISESKIDINQQNNIFFMADEHQSATDGRYELKEALEQELNIGTYNFDWGKFFEPIFYKVPAVIDFNFCNSETTTLVRLADIISNYSWHKALDGKISDCVSEGFTVKMLP